MATMSIHLPRLRVQTSEATEKSIIPFSSKYTSVDVQKANVGIQKPRRGDQCVKVEITEDWRIGEVR